MRKIHKIKNMILITTSLLLLSGCNQIGDQLNSGIEKELEESKLINVLSLAKLAELSALTAPSGLSVTEGSTKGVINLNWQPVDGASGYKIYWSDVAGVTTASTAITDASLPYVHSGLADGTYYYAVTAVNASSESTLSSEKSASVTSAPNIADNNDGTVYVKSKNLIWAKCSQSNTSGGNMYNSAANDCSNGTAGAMWYCTDNSNSTASCFDPATMELVGAVGTAISPAYGTCDSLMRYIPGHNWRVPTIEELKEFYDTVYAPNQSLFPATAANAYWSSSTYAPTPAAAWTVYFGSGGGAGTVFAYNKASTSLFYVRCVSTGL